VNVAWLVISVLAMLVVGMIVLRRFISKRLSKGKMICGHCGARAGLIMTAHLRGFRPKILPATTEVR
jgi:hypothetical protein